MVYYYMILKLSEYCALHKISYQSGWNNFKAGKIPNAYKTESGSIYVKMESDSEKESFVVVYARVSSSEQSKTNLPKQADRLCRFAEARGDVVNKVIKEVGSGLNDRRPKLNSLLRDNKVTKIYIEHTDRITRFGLEYIKIICEIQKIELVIINEAETDEQDIMQDFISLVTSFCSRLYGLHRSKRKTEAIIKEIKNDSD